MTNPHHIADIKEFDKIKSIECIYPLTAGLTSRSIQKAINSSLEITDELPEWIPESVLKSNKWISWSKSVKKLHNPDKIYENHSSPHLERLVFDELLSHQLTIRLIKNKINKIKGNKLEQKGILTEKLKTLLDFKLTNDQIKSIDEISDDLKSENKMLRLLQGDVGSGKTIVALFSILQSIENSKRSVLMAPTELLAEQHFNTINKYNFKCNI